MVPFLSDIMPESYHPPPEDLMLFDEGEEPLDQDLLMLDEELGCEKDVSSAPPTRRLQYPCHFCKEKKVCITGTLLFNYRRPYVIIVVGDLRLLLVHMSTRSPSSLPLSTVGTNRPSVIGG